ncbi:hypothetical protein H2201_002381 [Coniosporium apollinis]|uniref:Major facilitator superfamily (MFS) profile domain-containing protein n=1 Tax=Coniosporium apollinis TaxID=61459 RepID=A0ABQ9NZE4_9PEZI|nr:hypothetical protein H2201_002381 [Coniosporium apollinis]
MSSFRTQQNAGSSTYVIELEDRGTSKTQIPNKPSPPQSVYSVGRRETPRASHDEDRQETLPSPTTHVAEQVQKWNYPRINVGRTMGMFLSFTVMGLNDGAYGALIPYLETYYHLTYTVVSLIFLSPLIGYTLSALLNNSIHLKFGQRGVALIGPTCHLLAFSVISVHPPWPVMIVVFMFAGFGNGLMDAGWNAWVGALANPNEVLGFLHGFYGVGATLGPLIATTMITKANWPWYYFFYFMIAISAVELVLLSTTFWGATSAVFRAANARTSEAKGSRMKEALFTQPSARVTWICAFFFLGYVGAEVALGGWIVTFMMRVREGDPFSSGMTATGFWLGITVGRFVLGFITPRIGEKLAISIYLPLAMALELLFWLVPQFYVSAVAVSLQGFFLGPLFPVAVVVATKLLPKHLHVSAIGFAAAFGGGGAAIFPFAVGAIAQAKGVQVLQPIILAILGAILALWMGLPRMGGKRKVEEPKGFWGRVRERGDVVGMIRRRRGAVDT